MKINPLKALSAALILPAMMLGLAACGKPAAKPSPVATTASSSASAAPEAKQDPTMTVTDLAGRSVTIPEKIERMVFGESRLAYASVLLNKKNPVEGVVAWGKDLQSNAPDIYKLVLKVSPQAKDIPTIGSLHKGDINIETVMSYKPQVMFISLDQYEAGKENGTLAKLDAVKLPYLVTDFRQQPVENTEKTVALLGKVTGKTSEASAFIDYYKKTIKPVMDKASELSKKAPSTFIWRAPGLLGCCSTFTKSNFAAILVASGGKNLADTVTPGENGALTPEAVIAAQPDQIIATGGEWAAKKLNKEAKTGFLPMGYNTDKATAQKGLEGLMKQPGFSELKAGKNGAVHGVYHQLYDSPWNFIAYLQFAKWSNPAAFADIDVDKVWKDFHTTFMPWEAAGTFFVTIK